MRLYWLIFACAPLVALFGTASYSPSWSEISVRVERSWDAPAVRLDDPLRHWLSGLWRGGDRGDRVFLHAPKPSAEPTIAVGVTTSLPGVSAFCIDVDLDHNGRFEGPGELGYAEGRFDATGTGQVRLHGLIHGRYQVRARVSDRGRDRVSAIGSI